MTVVSHYINYPTTGCHLTPMWTGASKFVIGFPTISFQSTSLFIDLRLLAVWLFAQQISLMALSANRHMQNVFSYFLTMSLMSNGNRTMLKSLPKSQRNLAGFFVWLGFIYYQLPSLRLSTAVQFLLDLSSKGFLSTFLPPFEKRSYMATWVELFHVMEAESLVSISADS